MKSIKLTIVLTALVLGISCKKDGDRGMNCDELNKVQMVGKQSFPDRYIVKLKDGGELLFTGLPSGYAARTTEWQKRSEAFLSSIGLVGVKPLAVFSGVFYGFELKLDQSQLQLLRGNPLVDIIEPVKMMSVFENCTSEPMSMGIQRTSTGASRVGTGNGVGKRAWILDTGIDTDHPDLTVNVSLGRDFTNGVIMGLSGTEAVNDVHGHGTHVAGIVGAKNNAFGTIGIAAGAELVPLKVLDSIGSGNSSILTQGLDYLFLVGLAGEVANLSLGGDATALVDLAVQRVAAKGLFVAIAAGNNSDAASNYSPARAEGNRIYTVSAIDANDRFASYSNFGNPPVDYAEPGNSILSTYLNGQYAFLTGTSMSTPHLAGILLLKGGSFNTEGSAINDPDGFPDKIAVAK